MTAWGPANGTAIGRSLGQVQYWVLARACERVGSAEATRNVGGFEDASPDMDDSGHRIRGQKRYDPARVISRSLAGIFSEMGCVYRDFALLTAMNAGP